MRFAEVLAGTRSEKRIEIESAGRKLAFLIRPLDAMEDALALERATAFAREKKADSVAPGNPIFDIAYAAHTLALAALDVDSPPDARQRYFDSAAEVMGAFGPEEIVFLYERYQLHQGESSPVRHKMSSAELLAELVKLAEAQDDLPFVRMPPGTRLIAMRSMARVLLSSPEDRSRLSSLFGSTPNA